MLRDESSTQQCQFSRFLVLHQFFTTDTTFVPLFSEGTRFGTSLWRGLNISVSAVSAEYRIAWKFSSNALCWYDSTTQKQLLQKMWGCRGGNSLLETYSLLNLFCKQPPRCITEVTLNNFAKSVSLWIICEIHQPLKNHSNRISIRRFWNWQMFYSYWVYVGWSFQNFLRFFLQICLNKLDQSRKRTVFHEHQLYYCLL